MRRAVAALLLGPAIGCDCGGRNVDVFQYRCTDSSTCGDGWSCVNGGCVEGAGGGSAGLGGGAAGGGTATGGGASGHVTPGTICNLGTMKPCGALDVCFWRGPSLSSFTTGVCLPGCDPVKQDCGPGQRCALDRTGYFSCMADGTLGEGLVCVPGEPDSCQAGLGCAADLSRSHVCRRFCSWSSGSCPAGQHCTNTSLGVGGRAVALACQPNPCALLSTSCGISDTCRPAFGGGNQCELTGASGAGMTCSFDENCGANMVCANTACAKLCSLGGTGSGCDATTRCLAATDPTGFPLEGGAVGTCR